MSLDGQFASSTSSIESPSSVRALVPNVTLYLIASAGTYMPRAKHLNGDGNEDRNLYLCLPKDCLCSNIKPLEQQRVSNLMSN